MQGIFSACQNSTPPFVKCSALQGFYYINLILDNRTDHIVISIFLSFQCHNHLTRIENIGSLRLLRVSIKILRAAPAAPDITRA